MLSMGNQRLYAHQLYNCPSYIFELDNNICMFEIYTGHCTAQIALTIKIHLSLCKCLRNSIYVCVSFLILGFGALQRSYFQCSKLWFWQLHIFTHLKIRYNLFACNVWFICSGDVLNYIESWVLCNWDVLWHKQLYIHEALCGCLLAAPWRFALEYLFNEWWW